MQEWEDVLRGPTKQPPSFPYVPRVSNLRHCELCQGELIAMFTDQRVVLVVDDVLNLNPLVSTFVCELLL